MTDILELLFIEKRGAVSRYKMKGSEILHTHGPKIGHSLIIRRMDHFPRWDHVLVARRQLIPDTCLMAALVPSVDTDQHEFKYAIRLHEVTQRTRHEHIDPSGRSLGFENLPPDKLFDI